MTVNIVEEMCPICNKSRLEICRPGGKEIKQKCFECNKVFDIDQDVFADARFNLLDLFSKHVAAAFTGDFEFDRCAYKDMYLYADQQIRELKQNLSSRSELRNGYMYVETWVDEGMDPRADLNFTEGDLRLAAQLCEYAVKQLEKNNG